MKWLDDLARIPGDSWARRALYAALIAAGVTMTGLGSIFMQRTGPIPFKLLPDIRPVLFIGSGLTLGLYASGGGARRRAAALWGVVGYVMAFHLEEATVHWIGPIPGSITGTPVGLVGTSGSLLAIVAVLLMHVEVESYKLAEDLAARGAQERDAQAMARQMRGMGARRIGAIAAGVAALGALVLAVSPIFGNASSGGAWVLVPGALLLALLAVLLSRWVPRRVT